MWSPDGCRSRPVFHIALGSLAEMDYQPLLGRDLGYLSSAEHEVLESRAEKVCRMLIRFLKQLRFS